MDTFTSKYTADQIEALLDNINNMRPATIRVGTVETIEPGESVSIENVGTDSDVVLNFKIPKGSKGDAYPENIHGLFGYSASGRELFLEPTSDFPISELKLFGKSEQEIEGTQLLDPNKWTNSNSGTGVIKENGRIIEVSGLSIWAHIEQKVECKEGEILHLSLDNIKSTSTYSYISIRFFNNNARLKEIIIKDKDNHYEATEKAPAGTTTTIVSIFVNTDITPSATQTATVTGLIVSKQKVNRWKPFGAAPVPSPDNPRDIEIPGLVCKGNQIYDFKTMFEYNVTTNTPSGVSLKILDDGKITLNGTATDNAQFRFANGSTESTFFKNGETYTISGIFFGGNHTGNVSVTISFWDSGWTYISQKDIVLPGNATFTVPDNCRIVQGMISLINGVTVQNLTIGLMINRGSTPLPYEPFSNGINQLDITAESTTLNGVTFTVNQNKSITVSGTNTESYSASFNAVPGPINISETMCLVFHASTNVRFYFNVDGTDVYDIGKGGAYTIEAGQVLSNLYIYVPSGTVSNETVNIMLVKPEYANYPYSPYVADGGNIRKFNVIGVEARTRNLLSTNGWTGLDGGTYSVKEDGRVVEVSGTSPWANAAQDFNCIEGENIFVRTDSFTSNYPNTHITLEFFDQNSSSLGTIAINQKESMQETQITAPAGSATANIYIVVNQGETASTTQTATVTGLIVSKEKVDKWEPYRIPSTAILRTPSGLPGIKVPDDYVGYTYDDESGQKWVADTIEYDGNSSKYIKRVGHQRIQQSLLSTDYAVNYAIFKRPEEVKITHTNNLICSATNVFKVMGNSGWDNGVTGIMYMNWGEINMGLCIGESTEENMIIDFYYILPDPVTIDMGTETDDAFQQFHTLDKNTNVFNSGNCLTNMTYTVDTRTEVEKRH